MTATQVALATAGHSLRPPPKLRYSEWASTYFRLPADTSAVSGRYRPWRFQQIMLDLIGDPLVERVTIPKGARIGYTKTLIASIAADAANDPCPIILLVPTDDDARGMAVDEIDPAFRETPALQGIMKVGRYDGRNTLTQRALLGGGSLKILSARAPRNLRRHTTRKLYCDEVDGMEVTQEGDPIKLAEKRTESYGDRKIVLGSTPTDEITSIIWRRWLESDQGVFQVKCPHCADYFEMLWEHISWPEGEPEQAVANCPLCGSEIEERYKPQIQDQGRRYVLKPEIKNHAGFRVNTLVSLQPNASWGKLASEYLQAKRAGPAEMQVFYNTVLGLPWSSSLDQVDEGALMARVENFGIAFDPVKSRWRADIPPEVFYITAGVDVQVDRLEVTFIGWSETQVWLLGHEVIRGATNVETTWFDLDGLLLTRWKHPLGNEIGIEAGAVDAGDGNRTQYVYDFCGPRLGRRIVPIKGMSGPRPVIEVTKSKKTKRASARLHIVGVDQVKTHILTSLAIEKGQLGCFRFSNTLDEEWFKQLTAERRVVEYPRGRPEVRFQRIGFRAAEALDCTVYGIAVRGICRFDFAARALELTASAPAPHKPSLRELAERLNGRGKTTNGAS